MGEGTEKRICLNLFFSLDSGGFKSGKITGTGADSDDLDPSAASPEPGNQLSREGSFLETPGENPEIPLGSSETIKRSSTDTLKVFRGCARLACRRRELALPSPADGGPRGVSKDA